jgi:hypothetical protein
MTFSLAKSTDLEVVRKVIEGKGAAGHRGQKCHEQHGGQINTKRAFKKSKSPFLRRTHGETRPKRGFSPNEARPEVRASHADNEPRDEDGNPGQPKREQHALFFVAGGSHGRLDEQGCGHTAEYEESEATCEKNSLVFGDHDAAPKIVHIFARFIMRVNGARKLKRRGQVLKNILP